MAVSILALKIVAEMAGVRIICLIEAATSLWVRLTVSSSFLTVVDLFVLASFESVLSTFGLEGVETGSVIVGCGDFEAEIIGCCIG